VNIIPNTADGGELADRAAEATRERNSWCTSANIDGALIITAGHVEGLEVLEEMAP